MSRSLASLSCALALISTLTACATPTRQSIGVGTGAAVGAVVGGVATGSRLGAAGGAAIGGIIGHEVSR